MRPARDTSAGRSATPIYDELYAEWRRCFRALPGDRSGEEDLGLTGFAAGPYGYTGPAAQSHTDRHHPHSPTDGGFGGAGGLIPYQIGPWYQEMRQHPTGGRPQAALPPAPRREV